MSDREARALGAGSTITVEGIEYTLSPVKLQQLAELQRAAVRNYKREYLETYAENIRLLPKEKQESVLEKKLDEVARWDIDDLPPKRAYSAEGLSVTAGLRTRLEEIFSIRGEWDSTAEREDADWLELLEEALNSDEIRPGEVKKLTGGFPTCEVSPYDMWWATAVHEGRINFVYESARIRHPKLKKSEVGQWPLPRLAEAVKIIVTITRPEMGNT